MTGVALTNQLLSGTIRNALSALPAKAVAIATGNNVRTIENIKAGQNAPSAATLIEMMKHFDEVYEAVLSLAQRHSVPSGTHQERIEQAMKVLRGESHEINSDRVSQLGRDIDVRA